MKHIVRTLALFCAAVLMLAVSPARAAVTGVQPIPASANAIMGPGSAVTVNWRITRTPTPTPYTVASNQGKFLPNPNAIVPWATTGSIMRTLSSNQSQIFITETALVPQAVMEKALKSNGGNFIYQRSFSDDNFATQSINSMAFKVAAGGIGGPLTITEERLSFDDGSTSATRDAGSMLTAKAVLNVSGMGQLRAVWEVNDSGADTAFYRPVRDVTQTVAGQRNIFLISPPLPTKEAGRRNVRLRIIDPGTGFEPPSITYYIAGAAGQAEINRMPVVLVTAPADGAVVREGSVFSWQAVKGAAGYKIQIMERADSGGIAARIMVKGDKTSAALSPLAMSQLETPASYRWHVIAFDKNGETIAVSRPHPVRIGSGPN